MSSLKIAVIGGAGFIGSRLVRKLVDKGYEVVIIDLVNPSDDLKVEKRIADITSLEQITSALKGVDYAYHLAGLVLYETRKNARKAVAINVVGTVNVLEACLINGVKKLLFASTFYVYDGIDEKMIVNEETPPSTNMEFFGATKLMGETLVKEYSRRFGLQYVLFRFGSAYGLGPSSNVIGDFINAALKGEPMVIWGEGKRKNQYTFVDDIAEGCVLGLDKTNETYNLIFPEQTSIAELTKVMERKYNFKAIFDSLRKEGASMPYMSSRKAMIELGWKPISLEDGIERTVASIEGLTHHITIPS